MVRLGKVRKDREHDTELGKVREGKGRERKERQD